MIHCLSRRLTCINRCAKDPYAASLPPLMTPVIFFQLILGIIGSLQQFALPMLLAGGRMGSVPPRDAYFFVVHVMRQIFTFSRFGYGLALMWVLFVVVVILTILVFRTSRYWVFYEVDVEGEKR